MTAGLSLLQLGRVEAGQRGDAFQGHLHPGQEKGGIGGKKKREEEENV